MIEIIKESWTEEIVDRWHSFDRKDDTTCGYIFHFDANGDIVSTNPEFATATYEQLRDTGRDSEGISHIDMGMQERTQRYRHPAIGRCSCGAEITLQGFVCSCECGLEYNSCGQQLAPRSQWGEETGESVADIFCPIDVEEIR